MIRTQKETQETSLPFLVQPYQKSNKQLLLGIFDQMSLSTKGNQTLKSRFEHQISRTAFEQYLDAKEARYRAVLIDHQKKILGWGEYFVGHLGEHRAELSRIVLPEYQGKKLGTQLLVHLINECKIREPQITQIESVTRIDNSVAIHTLTKLLSTYPGRKIYETQYQQVRFVFYLHK